MDEIIKKRTIKVEGMTCEGCEKKINDTISNLKGVKQVKADKAGEVHLQYNLLKIKLEDIEKQITKLGYNLSNKLVDKMKRGWIHNTEQNEYDTMTAPAAPCCSNPGAILKKNE